MPIQATDRPRLALAAIAIASVGLTLLSIKVVNAATRTAAKPLPANDLRSLSAYLAPLPDTTRLAVVPVGSMVGESDPFGAPLPVSRIPSGSVPSNTTSAGSSQQWVVSSILFESSKRSAIVNDAWVSVGDPLAGGAHVSAIERKHVVVTDA